MTDKPSREDIDLSLKLFIVLSRANKAVAASVEKDIKSHGLNPTEFQVLELLHHKGDQPIQHIGRKVLLASASITYVVDKLEKKQLIEHKTCPKDRRVTYASITSRGSELISKMFPIYNIFNKPGMLELIYFSSAFLVSMVRIITTYKELSKSIDEYLDQVSFEEHYR